MLLARRDGTLPHIEEHYRLGAGRRKLHAWAEAI